MELDDFEPLFGEPNVEWSAATASQVTTPVRPFLFQIHAPDSSSLGVNVTDFFSNSFGAVRSIQQLEDMRDDTGIGGSWSEFLEYLVNSIKFGDVKLVLEGHRKSDGPESARLVAQKSKGMPRISVFLLRLVGTAANEVMARLSLDLYKAFKSSHKLLVQEQDGCDQLRKMLPAAEQEKSEHIQTHVDFPLHSKRHKIHDKVTSSSATTTFHDVSDKQADQNPSPMKASNRVVPAHRRIMVVFPFL
ncbi:hypothetical protein Ccrd_024398, partial [Cynara cardunculus var. scolymus]